MMIMNVFLAQYMHRFSEISGFHKRVINGYTEAYNVQLNFTESYIVIQNYT